MSGYTLAEGWELRLRAVDGHIYGDIHKLGDNGRPAYITAQVMFPEGEPLVVHVDERTEEEKAEQSAATRKVIERWTYGRELSETEEAGL